MKQDLSNQFYKQFNDLCTERQLFPAGSIILAAVSGGADSTALLDLCARWHLDVHNNSIAVAHFNHLLRPEAEAEEQHVEDLCRQLEIDFFKGQGDVARFARASNRAGHDAARELRYRFLVETAQTLQHRDGGRSSAQGQLQPVRIVTGHHLNDQVETVLMRLFEGSGSGGLSGIRTTLEWADAPGVTFVRPLLDFRREQLEQYCQARGLNFVTDDSNFDLSFPRNRIRHRIVPEIVAQFGVSTLTGVARSAKLINLDHDFVEAETDKIFSPLLVCGRENELALAGDRFETYPEVVRLHCLRKAFQLLSPNRRRLTLERCRTAVRHLRQKQAGHLELGCGIYFCQHRDLIWIYRLPPAVKSLELAAPGSVIIEGWGQFTLELRSAENCQIPPPAGTLVLDFDKLGSQPLTLTAAQPGDTIVPLGLKGRKNLRDLLHECGIPPFRRQYPILKTADQIVAVPPFRIADIFKVDDSTARVAVITWVQT